jgi:hypothetical protein
MIGFQKSEFKVESENSEIKNLKSELKRLVRKGQASSFITCTLFLSTHSDGDDLLRTGSYFKNFKEFFFFRKIFFIKLLSI